jgi:tetrahydromethanopterin S-methyltransferase subunit A
MKGYVDKYGPKISSEIDEAYIRFNEDSDQINYMSNIIQSDQFKQRYNKISEFVDIMSVEDIERINQLILNIDPVEVGELIHALCKVYDCG